MAQFCDNDALYYVVAVFPLYANLQLNLYFFFAVGIKISKWHLSYLK